MIKENQKRAEAAETLMLRLEQAINSNICRLGKDLGEIKETQAKIQAAQEIFYETFMAHTMTGRWIRLKKWIGRK
jgi:hypothetical protein